MKALLKKSLGILLAGILLISFFIGYDFGKKDWYWRSVTPTFYASRDLKMGDRIDDSMILTEYKLETNYLHDLGCASSVYQITDKQYLIGRHLISDKESGDIFRGCPSGLL